jgi:hypothetical protein
LDLVQETVVYQENPQGQVSKLGQALALERKQVSEDLWEQKLALALVQEMAWELAPE